MAAAGIACVHRTAALLLAALLLSGCVGWLHPERTVLDPARAADEAIHFSVDHGQPVFQGDIQHTGYFPGLVVPESVAVAWQVTPWNVGEHSAAKGSPVVADGTVYVGADDGTVAAFTLAGDEVWRNDLSDSKRGTHGTPLVTDDYLYIGTYDGHLHMLDRDTGERLWRQRLGGSVAASPLIFEGVLYISVETAEPSGRFFALDPATGDTLWRDYGITDHPHSSIAIDPLRRVATVGANDGVLYAWDIDTRERLWTFATRGGEDGDIKAPILVADGGAFFGSWDHHVYRVHLENGTLAWAGETGHKVMGAPALDPTTRTLYIGGHDKVFRALDADDGSLRWSYRTGGWIIGAATVTDNAVLVGSYDKHLYAFDKFDGSLLWRFQVDGYPTSAPLVVDGPDGTLVVFADRAVDGPGSLWALKERAP